MEAIVEQLRQIFEKLKELSEYQREMNSTVAEHSRWIAAREREIDSSDDRFKMIEECVDRHQSYIDQRAATLKEFEEIKRTVAIHDAWIIGHKAETEGLWTTVSRIATLAGLIILILKSFKFL
jgi:hypothetical protein